MRLAKKAVAIALTAVMALSMLTACGGGGGSSSGGNNNNGAGNGGNNSSSNVGGDTNGGSASSGSNSGSNSGTSTGDNTGSGSTGGNTGTTTGTIPFNKSKIYGLLSLKEYYTETVDSDGSTEQISVKNENEYSKDEYTADGQKEIDEVLTKGKDRYTIIRPGSERYEFYKEGFENRGYNTDKMTVPIYLHSGKGSETPEDNVTAITVKTGTGEFEKKTYYTETIVFNKNNYAVYYFDEDGKPKAYEFITVDNNGKVEEREVTKVTKFEYHVSDTSVFEIPNGAAIIEEEYNSFDELAKQFEDRGLISKN